MKTNFSIQMYSLRDITKTNLEDALRTVAELGYGKVEFAGFFDNSAEQVRTWLDRYHLEVSGTHTAWTELTDDRLEATIAYHKILGNTDIIIPSADLTTEHNLDEFISLVNHVQSLLEKEGIRLGYHNHHREFLPTEYGKVTHHELETRTALNFEIDTYWAYVAGQDPIAVLERLKDRVHVIHLKDGDANGHGCALGEGTAPVDAVRKKATELGMQIVVESEGLNPTGAEEVARCIRYLTK